MDAVCATLACRGKMACSFFKIESKSIGKRLGLVFVLSWVLILAYGLSPAYSYTLSMTLAGPKVDFGTVSPADPPVIIPHVTQIVVVSTGGSWQLSVQASGDFVTTPTPTHTFPVSRLSWALHPVTTPEWTPFSTSATTVTTGDATPTTGKVVDLDYKLDIHYSDPASTMTYQTTITYTVSLGSIDISFAIPNPFNPAVESTTIHYLLGVEATVTIEILDVYGETVRTLSPSPANPQPAGPQSVVWDGRDGAGVIVADGQYRYLIQDGGGGVIASGVIVVDSGTAMVQGAITDAATTDPLAKATVTLFRSDGTKKGSTTSSATAPIGSYSFSAVQEGYYYLRVERFRFVPKTTDVFFVPRGGAITQNVSLTRNRAFFLTKEADTKVAAIGDIIKYTVTLQNIGFGDATEVRIEDQLPPGFIYIWGTSYVEGYGSLEPTVENNTLRWEIGELLEMESVTITYMAAVGFETELGDRTNRAFAFGKVFGEEVSAGPASAAVRVRGGLFRREGTIIGKVFFDDNGNGIQDDGEAGFPGAEIVLDDGTHVITDDFGRYSIPNVRPGRRVVRLLHPLLVTQSENPRLIYVPASGLARADFAIRPGKDKCQGLFPVTFVGIAELEIGLSDWSPYVDPNLRFYMQGEVGELLSRVSFDLDGGIGLLGAPLYPTYGDGSQLSRAVRPVDGVFFQLAYGRSSVKYGRYDIRFAETEFTSYTRSLPGLKAQLCMGAVNVTGFLARTRHVPARDEIRGADIYGPYILTHSPIVRDSEWVRIIIRDKDDPTVIIRVEEKEADVDYHIDPDRGEIFFVVPIPSEDPIGNPVFIVVNYEFIPLDVAPVFLIVGGRLEVSLADFLQFGLTYIKESQSPKDYQLGGIDAVLTLGNVTFSAESAQSSGDLYDLSGPEISFARRASLAVDIADGTRLTSFYRLVEPDFLNLTNPVPQTDIREVGATFDHRITESITLSTTITRSHNNVLNQPAVTTLTSFSPFDLDLKYRPPAGWQLDLGYALTFSFDDLTPHKEENSTGIFSFSAIRPFSRGRLTFDYSLKSFDDFTDVRPDTIAQMLSGEIRYSLFDNVLLSVAQDLNLKIDKNSGEALSLTGITTVGTDLQVTDNIFVSLIHRRNMDFMVQTSSAVTTATLHSDFCLTEHTTSALTLEVSHSSANDITGKIFLRLASTLSEGVDSSLQIKLTPFAEQLLESASFSLTGDVPDVVSFTGTVEFTPTEIPLSLVLYGDVNEALSVSIDLAARLSGGKASGHLSLGVAYRPWKNDRLNLLASFRISGSGGAMGQESSFEAIYELFPRLSISGRFVNKIVIREEADVRMKMVIGRVDYELIERLNLIGEARLYHQDVDRSLKDGFMIELGYRLWNNAQVAVGFNFSDSLSLVNGITRRGPFIRVGVIGF